MALTQDLPTLPLVPAPGSAPIARTVGLTKTYGVGPAAVSALDDVTVEFERGRLTAIMGPSGSGKSTLMHCMAALDAPTSGRVVIDGVDISHLKDRALTRLRRDRLGFVFQAYNLIPTLTARENITLPMDIAGRTALAHLTVDRSLYLVAVPAGLQSDVRVFVRATPDADLGSLRTQLDGITSPYLTLSVQDRAEFATEQGAANDTVLNLLYVLLLFSVVIAVLGIVNTLALSVLERTREIGLLRAVGLLRRQLGGMITVEAIATAVFGAVLGTLLGLGLGIALQHGLQSQGLSTLGIPWTLVLAMLVASILVGVLAAVAPSFRAARLNVLEAITGA